MSRNIAFSSTHVFRDVARAYTQGTETLRVYTTSCTDGEFFEGAVTHVGDALVLALKDDKLAVIAWDTIEVITGDVEPISRGIAENVRISNQVFKAAPDRHSRESQQLTPRQVVEAMRNKSSVVLSKDEPSIFTQLPCTERQFAHEAHVWISGGTDYWCPGKMVFGLTS